MSATRESREVPQAIVHRLAMVRNRMRVDVSGNGNLDEVAFPRVREELGVLQRDIGIVDTGHHDGTEWQFPQWHGIESG